MDVASTAQQENERFENDVRRIARQLWPEAQYSGSVLAGGRERDGVFETEESVHLIEITTSRTKSKAEQDCKKLSQLAQEYQKKSRDKAVRSWFITLHDPSPEQRQVAKRFRVTSLSFQQFQSRLIDSRTYLSLRDQYSFGSVRDPETGKPNPAVDFVPLGLSASEDHSPAKLDDILSELQNGGRIVLLGDYGAGKSMTLRYLYHELKGAHNRSESAKFPVFINLRDHYGQNDPAELLQRHARLIGFERPDHLVRAWRSGYVHLLLDGFDETTSLNLQGLWSRLRDNRYRAMEVVRKFTSGHPDDAGVVLAGRTHFFDSVSERRKALGLDSSDAWREYNLDQFTDEQIRTYFKRSGLKGSVPPWLPSRPLLVAYLAGKGLLTDLLTEEDADAVVGWDLLLDGIASRESQIEAGIDGELIRRILERLATKARANHSGRGPLNPEALVGAFREVCGYPPDERGMVLLQRLPGLGADATEEGSRALIDEEFADACRAGDLFRFAIAPYDFEFESQGNIENLLNLEIPVGWLGIAIAARRAERKETTSRQLATSMRVARERNTPTVLVADLARLTIEMGHPFEEDTVVSDVLVEELEITAELQDSRRLTFRDCLFRRLDLEPGVEVELLPRFESCYVGELHGRVSRGDLPSTRFDKDCIIEAFAAPAETTADVLALELPLGTRVLLTILKKLYERPGSGRKESALYRGLDLRAQRFVPDVLSAIQSEGMANVVRRGNENIWLPDRKAGRRAMRMITAPIGGSDPLLKRVADLSVN